jgi:hypothetical protein
LDKIPWYLQIPLMAGLVVGAGVLASSIAGGAAAGIVATHAAGRTSAGTAGGLTFFKNFIAKWTHHTKEQNTHEKDITRDYAKIKAKMDGWRKDLEGSTRRERNRGR